VKARGFSSSQIGLFLGIFELAGILGPIMNSRLADSRSTYRLLLAGSIVVSAIALVPLQFAALLPLAAFCAALMGFSYRSSAPLLDSAVSRILRNPPR
jgi:PPP family 3-phenylpropionic acid transporter